MFKKYLKCTWVFKYFEIQIFLAANFEMKVPDQLHLNAFDCVSPTCLMELCFFAGQCFHIPPPAVPPRPSPKEVGFSTSPSM